MAIVQPLMTAEVWAARRNPRWPVNLKIYFSAPDLVSLAGDSLEQERERRK